ncbi:MAG: histidine kinase [Saprospiraceae bacterium]|nr:histidine kinase [Saprospiraceae bacterium]
MKVIIKNALNFFTVIIFCNYSLTGQGENFFNYSISEGLPQSQVFAICQDSSGYIWAGTQGGGVAIFDGEKFKSLSADKGTFMSEYINVLYTGSDHKVWIGTMKGAYHCQKEKLKETKSEHKNNIQINAITEWNKIMYFGSNKGIYLYSPGSDSLLETSLDFKSSSIINDLKVVNGQLLVASDNGLWIQQNNTKPFKKVAGLPFPNINQIHADDFGFIWLAIDGFGLLKMDEKSHKIIEKYDNNLLARIKSMLSQPDDRLWLATENDGICIMHTCTGKISRISEDDGFSTSKIKTLLEDIWGNIWIGTSGAGLIKKTNQIFKYYNMFDYGFGGNRVYAIAKDKNNKILIAVNKDNVGYFDGQTFQKIVNDSLNIGVKIKTIATDTSGRLWIGTEGKGLYCLGESGVRVVNTANKAITDDWIIQIVTDVENRIWIATQSSGIHCFMSDRDSIINPLNFNQENGLPDNYIHSLAKDENNNRLWFVCRNGKAGFIDKELKFSVFDKNNGLPEKPIKTITIDSNGNCYIGIPGEGVYWSATSNMAEKVNFRKVLVSGKSYSTNMYSMICDPKGNLWLGTENGVHQFIKDQHSNSFADVVQYKREDGFLGIENCHNSICTDGNDNIWFGTMNGLVHYNAAYKTGIQAPPRLHLSDVLLFNQSVSQSGYNHCFASLPDNVLSNLPYNQNHLSFSFEAVHVNFPDQLKYRYMLEGADNHWSAWSTEKRINFSGIAPGNYCFKSQATFDKNQVSNTEQVCFYIGKPYWEENGFRFALALLVFALIIGIFKVRESSIRKKALAQTRELTLKNELLTLEQKALQLQMNPHFIFNALNSIQSLVVNHDPEAARKQIQNFALLMRGILNNSRNKTVSLNTEIELLTKYLNMEQFCQKNKFTYTIKVEQDIDQEETEIPSMLIQPYVENAIIHGITHLSVPGHVGIVFELQGQVLSCTITDNGVGRIRANELSLLQKEGHTSVSMEVTAQRLVALMNESGEIGQKIIDLYDDQSNAAGTKVILKIPVKTNY